MPDLLYTDIFIPGGFPQYTYHARTRLQLEVKLGEVLQNLSKLAIVTGHTKSGKTVLTRKILPRETAVWIDGGTIGSADDFWSFIVEQLELFQTTETSEDATTATGIEGSSMVGFNLGAKGEATLGGSVDTSKTQSAHRSRVVPSKIVALNGLRTTKIPLVVDDFHYIPRDLQGELVRALKPLIFDGLPVVIIAIPHRRYDAVKVEREMSGRFHPVEIPVWSKEELAYIPNTGFKLLNVEIQQELVDKLTTQSIGSPHLTQEFCRMLCKKLSPVAGEQFRPTDAQIDEVFADTAETIGRPIFEKLARGPRTRKDRIPRTLKTGEQVDIYQLVLHALAHEKPGLVTVEYEQLRAAIKAICAEGIPQLQDVARVLRHMSKIAATDQSSTPVIDFDDEERRLHITDPFFAFYLRWGRLDG